MLLCSIAAFAMAAAIESSWLCKASRGFVQRSPLKGYSKSMENLSRSEAKLLLEALDLLKNDYRRSFMFDAEMHQLNALNSITELQKKIGDHLEKLSY